MTGIQGNCHSHYLKLGTDNMELFLTAISGFPALKCTAVFLLATCSSKLATDFEGGKHGRIRKKIEGKNDRQEYD
jgi:hypothetical protein